ncbi:hypothetical protein GJ744_009661 [Endocarpon pusillum]|uniref:Uncharacterized protein n=1 Tax=Endocarpon pusillum TaxID=364733 RepID=A0A8H7AH97_9EURO|nr:hypothetical protein GJ744_009661 [Endocarpon pusillum]
MDPIIDGSDFCQNVEEEVEATEEQQRLWQRSAEEAGHRNKQRRKAIIPEHTTFEGKGKARATESE